MRSTTAHSAWKIIRPTVVPIVDAVRLHTTADTRPASVSHSITISQSSPRAARHADTYSGTIGFSVRKHRTNKPLDLIRIATFRRRSPGIPMVPVATSIVARDLRYERSEPTATRREFMPDRSLSNQDERSCRRGWDKNS
ncbi:hypothetical protein CH275_02095 [Rhodococcus sp. 06-235-1A]|nr:hypothetical protein CH275_02095 [Rhodococcus sp. 06-235-1A]